MGWEVLEWGSAFPDGNFYYHAEESAQSVSYPAWLSPLPVVLMVKHILVYSGNNNNNNSSSSRKLWLQEKNVQWGNPWNSRDFLGTPSAFGSEEL